MIRLKSSNNILSLTLLVLLVSVKLSFAQHLNTITANLDGTTKTIKVQQRFTYVNNSGVGLEQLYFLDWNHAYSSNTTPLAKKFGQDFNRSLHLAKDKEYSATEITSIVDNRYVGLNWERTPKQDIVKIGLNTTLKPKDSIELFLTYSLKLPDSKFTKYGYDNQGNYYLKDWYLTPAVFDGQWHLYSNKGLEDAFTDVCNTTINIVYPKKLYLASNFVVNSTSEFPQGKQSNITGKNRKSCVIQLTTEKQFTKHITEFLTVTTDIDVKRYDNLSAGFSISKVAEFLHDNLGAYPHQNLLVSDLDYEKNPLYGLNQLPSFVRPYDEQFQFEMTFLKTAITKYLEESLYVNPRKERWITDGLAYYLMIKFVEDYYPNEKLVGKLSKIWGIRGFQLAKKDFNFQYYWLQMLSTRSNIDQSLSTPNDSLIIFNQKIANRYKAGLGLSYLGDFLGYKKIENVIYDFYEKHKLQSNIGEQQFKAVLEGYANEDVDWFFDSYVHTRKKIDFKIKDVQKTEDSITLTIKNKRGTNVPVSLFGLKKDSVVNKYWLTNIDSAETFTIKREGIDRLVLNYDQKIPEFNQRDNWKTLNGFFASNKKLQFRFFRDAEDPNYNQIFYVPIANFNIYDGITPGIRIYNKTFLERPFTYDISPTYSFLEKTLVGKVSMRYRKYHGQGGHYVSNFSFGASTSHFQTNSRFTTITPAVVLGWRPYDLRSNKKQFLLFRYRNVLRNIDESVLNDSSIDLDLENNPDYSIFNARFTDIDNDIINYKAKVFDFQHSSEFTKLSAEFEYRRLFESDRQLNLRFYGGAFLRNKSTSDFFSFALDRPTDYMFDLGYIGRSESSGLASQQIIIAEGGFKSIFEDQFANSWIATTNASFNLWRWIEVYGDLGFIADRNTDARFVYGTGLRLNLVTDYFELYLPFYSNRGWEIGQPNYDKSIRFVVTISPRTLTGLFTRRWF